MAFNAGNIVWNQRTNFVPDWIAITEAKHLPDGSSCYCGQRLEDSAVATFSGDDVLGLTPKELEIVGTIYRDRIDKLRGSGLEVGVLPAVGDYQPLRGSCSLYEYPISHANVSAGKVAKGPLYLELPAFSTRTFGLTEDDGEKITLEGLKNGAHVHLRKLVQIAGFNRVYGTVLTDVTVARQSTRGYLGMVRPGHLFTAKGKIHGFAYLLE